MSQFAEALASAKTTVKSGKFGPFNQTKREAQTRFTLNPESEGDKVVVDLHTHHDPDSKVFRTTLTWSTVEPAEPGSVFSVECWASDHAYMTYGRTPVARYSEKALRAEHDEMLSLFHSTFAERGVAVFIDAAAKSGLLQTQEA